MKRAQRLKPVAEVANAAERTQVQRVAQAERRCGEAEQRLRDLERYHAEYQRNFQLRARTGLDSRRMQEFKTFMARLQLALDAQREQLRQLASERDHERHRLVAAATRKRALGRLIDKAETEERTVQERQLQRDYDERAMRTRSTTP